MSGDETSNPRSCQPVRKRDTAAFDDRPHGSERKHAAAVMSNDDLLSSYGMPPLLVATGSADPQKSVMAKNPDDLVRREPWSPALTQP
jgi:hypothetical protein